MGISQIELMLKKEYGTEIREIREEFLGKKFGIQISTLDDILEICGDLVLLRFPEQILLSNLSNENFSKLYQNENQSRFGLILKRDPLFLNGPKMTLRAYFNSQDYCISQIKYGEIIIFP